MHKSGKDGKVAEYTFRMVKEIEKLRPRYCSGKQFYYHSAKQDSFGYLY